MHTFYKRLLWSALIAAPLTASAGSSMSVTGGAISYTITDTDLADGVAAGISNIRYTRQVGVGTAPSATGYISKNALSELPLAIASQDAWADLRAAATGGLGQQQQSVSVTPAFDAATNYHYVYSVVDDWSYFTLKPHTRLNLTGSFTLTGDLQFTAEQAQVWRYSLRPACLSYNDECNGSQLVQLTFDHAGAFTKEVTYTSVMENGTNQSITGWLGVSSSLLAMAHDAYVGPQPSQVPEPSTYLLFGAGLPLAAWAVRRRRNASLWRS
ncbi:PEP-CTERM sorting domain-containing protein [Rugamonas sp. A1-17]|nr:PEP-CTERM sorting domain-containing protein [Rugamonas sp. A1-17]